MNNVLLTELYFSLKNFLSQYLSVKKLDILDSSRALYESSKKSLERYKDKLTKICKYLKIDIEKLINETINNIFEQGELNRYSIFLYKSIYLEYEQGDLELFQELATQIEAGSFNFPVFEEAEVLEFAEKLIEQAEVSKKKKDDSFIKKQDSFSFGDGFANFGQEIKLEFDFFDTDVDDTEKSFDDILDEDVDDFFDFSGEDFYEYEGIEFFERRLAFPLLPGYKYKIKIKGLEKLIPEVIIEDYFFKQVVTYDVAEVIDALEFEFKLPFMDFSVLPVFIFKEEVEEERTKAELKLKELFLERFDSKERKYLGSVECLMFTLLDKIMDFIFTCSSGERLDEDFANLDYLVGELEKDGVFPGDCKSLSTVMCGLLRSFGIIVRRVAGTVFRKECNYSIPLGHVWVEFFNPLLNCWCPFDANRSVIGDYVDPVEDEYYLYEQMIRIPKSSKFVSIKMDRVKI